MVERLANGVTAGENGAVQPHWHISLEDAAQTIQSIYARAESTAVVLISDVLSEDGEPTSAAREIMDAHDQRLLALVACTRNGQRVPEVHRTVRESANEDELHQALEVSLSYLRYMDRPPKLRRNLKIRIRQLRTESELRDCYALRHRIYRIMGYLEYDIERAPTRLEIDGCDECSIHLGAFDVLSGYDLLAGTARLVISSPEATRVLRNDLAQHTRNLIQSDPVIRSSIYERQLPLMLPVFQSQELNDELTEAMIHEWPCGELSRVIVDEPYRGAGMSEQLVESAVALALKAKLHKLYLECLKIHVPLYESLGFKVIHGKRGRVTGVSKTMIPMQRELGEFAAVQPAST